MTSVYQTSIVMNTSTFRASRRPSATLLLLGQLLYIVVTQFHTGGEANNHPAIFAAYAGSGIWTAVPLGQRAAIAILLAGLLALCFVLGAQAGMARRQCAVRASRMGATIGGALGHPGQWYRLARSTRPLPTSSTRP